MTSRERVLASFSPDSCPDRIPRWLGMSVEFNQKIQRALDLDEEGVRRFIRDDFRVVRSLYAGPRQDLSPGATWKSPIGVERKGIGFGMPLSHPLKNLCSLEELEAFPWPDPIGWISLP